MLVFRFVLSEGTVPVNASDKAINTPYTLHNETYHYRTREYRKPQILNVIFFPVRVVKRQRVIILEKKILLYYPHPDHKK